MKLLQSKYLLVALTIFFVGYIVSQTVRLPKFNDVEGFTIESFSNGILNADVRFKIENPNWFSYNGKELTCSLYHKGRLIANGSRKNKFSMRRKSINDLEMKMTFYADSLKDELLDFLMKDSITFEINVSGKFFMGLRSKANLNVTIPSEDLVNKLVSDLMGEDGIDLERIQLKDVNLEQSIFDVGFRFKNKLPFTVLVQDMKMGVFDSQSKSVKLAEWNFNVAKQVDKEQQVIITGESFVKNKESIITGIIKVMSGELNYYLSGFVTVSVDGRQLRIPMERHVRVDPISRKVIIID